MTHEYFCSPALLLCFLCSPRHPPELSHIHNSTEATGAAAAMASSRLLLAVAVVAGCAVGLSGSTEHMVHIVGGSHGWSPNMDYTLWSGKHTFFAGDTIAFWYQKGTHNVLEVNETGYDNCTMAGVAGNWTSGEDFILLMEPRRYFFICGNGFCRAGMKVAVTVHPQFHDHFPEIMPDRGAAVASVTARLMVTALAVAIAALA